MNMLTRVAILSASALLAACGGGGGAFSAQGDAGAGPDPTPSGPVVTALEVLSSSPQLPSDQAGSTSATISALVRDENNNVVPDIAVIFSADSGALQIVDQVTDAQGVARATLTTAGDPTNRAIQITATAADLTGSVIVNVVGTTLTLSGPGALAQDDAAVYTVVLTDSTGTGIAGEAVDVTSSAGNTLASASLTTGIDGDAQVELTATVAGADTLSASALSMTASRAITVSDDSFAIASPAPNAELALNTDHTVTANWQQGGGAVVGSSVTFSSTRGTLGAAAAVTDGAGNASVTINSTNAGPAVITATNADGTTTSVDVEFVATTAATIEVQANPFTVATGEQSAITATVRDAIGNLVKNKTVTFELDDITGGQISVSSDITDSQGRARTFYTGGSTPSAENGVSIRASVTDGATVIEDTVQLTVARQELFITIGTGNDLFEPNTATFAKEWVVFTTDSVGNGVANTNVQVSMLSLQYIKGVYTFPDPGESGWQYEPSAFCADEDVNRNGVLDPGEDGNANGAIEAGNVALVAAVDPDAPAGDPCSATGSSGSAADVTTNNQGIARVCVFYPQNFHGWVRVDIEAKAGVAGTEFAESQDFVLEAKAEDISNTQAQPPGQTSPFGVSASCADTL